MSIPSLKQPSPGSNTPDPHRSGLNVEEKYDLGLMQKDSCTNSMLERYAPFIWSSGNGATHTLISQVFGTSHLSRKFILILGIASSLEIAEELI